MADIDRERLHAAAAAFAMADDPSRMVRAMMNLALEAADAWDEAHGIQRVNVATLNTFDELKALEDPETVILDCKNNAYQRGIGLDGSEGWQSTRDPNPITSHHLLRFAPLTVLRGPRG